MCRRTPPVKGWVFHVKRKTYFASVQTVFHVNPLRLDVSRESFADAKLREDDIEQILDVHRPDYASQSIRRQSKLFGP